MLRNAEVLLKLTCRSKKVKMTNRIMRTTTTPDDVEAS